MNVLILVMTLIAVLCSVVCCVCAVYCLEKIRRQFVSTQIEKPPAQEKKKQSEGEPDNKATNEERRFYEGLQSILNYSSDTMKSYLKGEDED